MVGTFPTLVVVAKINIQVAILLPLNSKRLVYSENAERFLAHHNWLFIRWLLAELLKCERDKDWWQSQWWWPGGEAALKHMLPHLDIILEWPPPLPHNQPVLDTSEVTLSIVYGQTRDFTTIQGVLILTGTGNTSHYFHEHMKKGMTYPFNIINTSNI